MKKILFLVFSAVALLFSSCDNGSFTPSGKDPKVTKLEVSFKFQDVSQDVLDYFTIEFNYTDFEGKSDSKQITAPETISFAIDNPELGEEESCPFTVELKFTEKVKTAKAEGQYSNIVKYELDVNGYYSDGSLAIDSGSVQNNNTNMSYTDLDRFKSAVGRQGIEKITYKTFFCKTITDKWHIGVVGSRD